MSQRKVLNIEISGWLVDGVSIISRSWDFVRPVKNVTVQWPIMMKPVKTAKLLKGCLALREYLSVWKVHLFSACDYDIGLLLCCEVSQERIPYGDVLNEIRTCLELAIKASGECATAKRYAQIYKNSPESFHIISCDYALVGNNLADILKTRMPHVVDGVPLSCYFTGQSFGQCLDLDKFKPSFEANTNLRNAKETCVHYAKDIKSNEMLAAWERERTERGFAKKPSYEYCVAGIPGVANMYYNLAEQGISFKMTQLKLYSEINKHWKNNKSGRMETESLAEFLSKQDGISPFCLTRGNINLLRKQTLVYLTECDQLLSMFNGNLEQFTYSSARAEFIFSFDAGPVVLEHASKYAEEYFARFKMKSMVTYRDLDAVHAHMKKYMIPALTTMKNSLQGLINTLAGNGPSSNYIYGLENYLHISASEIVVHFMLRGTAMSQWKLRRCNNLLVRLLGFTSGNYRKEPPEFLFGDGNLRITEEGTLEYSGNYQECIEQCLRHNTGFPHIKFLLQLVTFGNGDVDMLNKSIFECIVCSATSIFQCKNTVRDTCKFSEFTTFDKTYIMHSANFISMLGEIGEQALAGNPLIRNMKALLGPELILNPSFLTLLIKYIDSQLIFHQCPLLFPVASLRKNYIIIPTVLTDQTEEVVALNLYHLAFKMKYPPVRFIYSNKLLSQIVDCVKLADLEDYWLTFKNMDRVFSRVFQASKEMTDKGEMFDVNVKLWFD